MDQQVRNRLEEFIRYNTRKDIYNDNLVSEFDWEYIGVDEFFVITCHYLPEFFQYTIRLITEGFGCPIVEDKLQGPINGNREAKIKGLAIGYSFPCGIKVQFPIEELRQLCFRYQGQEKKSIPLLVDVVNSISSIVNRIKFIEDIKILAESFDCILNFKI